MGLETASYVAGLTPSWPLAGDLKSQGDDHIRLLKTVLQATLPSGDRPFYFPKTEAISGTLTLDATDQNNTIFVTTTAGNVTVNLPSTLAAADKGWRCEVMKVTSDVNAAIVTPSAGTILSKSGATATIRVGILCEATLFIWDGTSWYCSKPGPAIGSTESFDGPTTPAGYLDVDGSVFSSTAFAELFAVLASSTLRDKRGRVEAGVDGGQGRLTSTGLGTAAILGAVNSVAAAEVKSIAQANLPNVNFIVAAGQTITGLLAYSGGVNDAGTGGLGFSGNQVQSLSVSGTVNSTGTAASGGSGTALSVVQSTIVVKKIMRAC